MTFNIYYTDRVQPDSRAINRAWYDAKTQRLALELHGSVYEYNGVPEFIYESLVNSESPGNFYQKKVKPNYGPGSRLGPVSDAREIRQVVVQDVTKAQKVTIAENNEPLRLSKDVPVRVNEPEYDHTVFFTLDGVNGEREHTFKAAGQDDAIEKMFDLADKLEQDIDITGVLVRFV